MREGGREREMHVEGVAVLLSPCDTCTSDITCGLSSGGWSAV